MTAKPRWQQAAHACIARTAVLSGMHVSRTGNTVHESDGYDSNHMSHTYTAHLNKNIDEHVHDASMQDYGRDEAPVFSRCDEDRHLASHLDERLRRHR
jgi:hypothetical protein